MADRDPQEFLENGKNLYDHGDHKGAATLFAAAAEAFGAQGDALSAAEARNNQCVALLCARNYAEALAAVQGTEMVFSEAGDLRRQGMAMANQASVLESMTRTREAADLYARSAEILEKAGESQMRADVLRSLAALRGKQGKFTEMVYAEQDGLLGLEKPTFKQLLLKFLMKFLFWKWKRK